MGEPANASVRAVCDVYQPRLEAALAAAKTRGFRDYRELLALPDLDAVLIATPDHWHGLMAAEALDAGKAAYVEPPLALRWQDAKRAADAAAKSKRPLQVGVTSAADARWPGIRERLQQGAIGALAWSQACFAANSRENPWNRPIEPGLDPKRLDWEAFLGPAPKRPFDPERFVRWRKFWDTSNGLASLELHERLVQLLLAVGPALPLRVAAAGSGRVFPDQEPPDNLHVLLQFPNEHSVVLMGTTACSEDVPTVIRGTEGTVHVVEGVARILCQPIHKDKHPPEVRVEATPRPSLLADFLACVRSGAEPSGGPTVAYPAAVAMDMATAALRTGEVIHREEGMKRG
jgi:predicted dehydrogenase